MSRVYVCMAPGLEEVECLAVVDMLKRGGVETELVSMGGDLMVTGSHNITIKADSMWSKEACDRCDAIFLPGGMPGTLHLKECSPLVELLKEFCRKGKKVAAICAAPTVLGEAGLLKGRKATCYPGCEDGLKGAEVLTDRVVIDGNITTSRGVGTAIPFALSLTAQLFDQNKADEIRESIVYGHGPAKN